jgi:hypothetical protein
VTPSASTRHWVELDLVGRQSPRDAVGARAYVTTGATTQMREVVAGESYHSGPPTLLHFGLGAAEVLERLELSWPSGNTQVFENLPVDATLVIKEGKDVVLVQ